MRFIATNAKIVNHFVIHIITQWGSIRGSPLIFELVDTNTKSRERRGDFFSGLWYLSCHTHLVKRRKKKNINAASHR